MKPLPQGRICVQIVLGIDEAGSVKKIVLVLLAMVLLVFISSGCVRKHCYFAPQLNQKVKVNVGSTMIRNVECFGRITVNDCTASLELVYLGHTGTYIRMGQREGVYGQVLGRTVGVDSTGAVGVYGFKASVELPSLMEFTYPIESRFIDFRGTQFEVSDVGNAWITFKLISIPTTGCKKVNGVDVE